MFSLLSRWVEWLLVAMVLCMALWSGRALADLVPTQEVAASPRVEMVKKLQTYGIAEEQARERVNAMSDAEVVVLAGKLDALPAGGALSNEQLILVVLLIVLLVILL